MSLHTSAVDWEAFLQFAGRFPCAYSYDGEARTLPTVAQLFTDRSGSHLLSISVGSVAVNCHFFVETEIELDLEPKEIERSSKHDQVLQFIEGLATAVAKPVLLTPENGPNIPYLSYEPTSGAWQVHE
jgi:hypothetical protein